MTGSFRPKKGNENGLFSVGCGSSGFAGIPVHVGAGVQVGTGVHVAFGSAGGMVFVGCPGGTVGWFVVPGLRVGVGVIWDGLVVAVGAVVDGRGVAVGGGVVGRGVLVGGTGVLVGCEAPGNPGGSPQ